MKQLISICLFFAVLSASPQSGAYHPLPDSNALWNINLTHGMCFMGGFGFEYYSIMISGDTIINGEIYHKLATPFVEATNTGGCTQTMFAGYKGAFRQDISLRRVYYIPPALTGEQLLYDFNLETGDTIRGYLAGFNEEPDIVLSIDSIQIGDSFHKRWLINDCYQIYLVEGIGSTYGLLEPSPGCATDMNGYSIECFSYNGEALYPGFTECGLITSVTERTGMHDGISVYPNPSTGTITVDLKSNNEISNFRLSSITGQTIMNRELDVRDSFTLRDLPKGIFVLSLLDNHNLILFRKLIVIE